jgi:anti-sigma factor RsiW
MPTEQQILLVHAYLDGELDPANALAVKAQIDSDPDLAAEFARADAVQKALRAHFPLKPIPETLRKRIGSMSAAGRWPRPTWAALAASVLLAVALSGGSAWLGLRTPAADPIAAEVLDGHLRSLIAAKPVDVETSDRHTVKPWFNGRIPQAPRVVDLVGAGFPLLGGRIDVIARTPVSTLVYQRRLHVISLTALPMSAVRAPLRPARTDNGYNTVHWTDGVTGYFAVSDLNAEELASFARLFQAAPSG